jgi:hypothetical protein
MSNPFYLGSSVRLGIAVFLLALTACGPQGPGTEALPEIGSSEERDAVLRVSDSFFQALSEADTATLSTLITPGAVLHSIRQGESGPVVGVRSREDFLAGIGSDTADFLERVWEPIVLVAGHVATVWTPYDFHIDGEFSHCGTDVVTLLRLEEGWRITGLTYDVVTEGCPTSPLGPPRTRLHPDMPQ